MAGHSRCWRPMSTAGSARSPRAPSSSHERGGCSVPARPAECLGMGTSSGPPAGRLPRATLLRGVLLWFGLALLVVAVLGSFNLPRYWRLARAYGETTGEITALEPGNHQLVRYAYRVDGREYQGEINGGPVGRPYQALRVGDPIRVYYSTEQRDASSVTPPGDQLFAEARSITLAAAIFPAFLLWRLWKLIR